MSSEVGKYSNPITETEYFQLLLKDHIRLDKTSLISTNIVVK